VDEPQPDTIMHAAIAAIRNNAVIVSQACRKRRSLSTWSRH